MELEELKKIWKKQEADEQESFTKEQLVVMLNNKLISFDEKIKRRDWLEIGVAVIIALSCLIILFDTQSIWFRLGCLTLIIASGVIIFKLVSARNIDTYKSIRADKSFGEHLKEELDKMNNQKRLLKSVFSWYLLPIFIGIVFFVIGFEQNLLFKVLYLAAVVILYGYIWKLNQNAVAEKVDPIIKDLEEAIDFIEKSTDAKN